MGQRYALCKDLAAGTNSAWTRIRRAPVPYRISGAGGYTGTVAIEHTPDGGESIDSLGTVADDDSLNIDEPVRELRVNGTGITGGTADVYLIEEY